MNFTKLEGAGNDFILVEAGCIEQNWAQLARAMCDTTMVLVAMACYCC